MILKSFDKNYWYSMEIEKTQWYNSDKNWNEDAIMFELNNIDNDELPKHAKIPNETGFLMSVEDAKQLKAFLEVALNGL